mmetsp:Transcript_17488/g.33791  ORF Transcript_17488/g.33791 Transcript_17488/m.33791 type:complete len:408 (+) Transcript_17488:649-1872(+)
MPTCGKGLSRRWGGIGWGSRRRSRWGGRRCQFFASARCSHHWHVSRHMPHLTTWSHSLGHTGSHHHTRRNTYSILHPWLSIHRHRRARRSCPANHPRRHHAVPHWNVAWLHAVLRVHHARLGGIVDVRHLARHGMRGHHGHAHGNGRGRGRRRGRRSRGRRGGCRLGHTEGRRELLRVDIESEGLGVGVERELLGRCRRLGCLCGLFRTVGRSGCWGGRGGRSGSWGGARLGRRRLLPLRRLVGALPAHVHAHAHRLGPSDGILVVGALGAAPAGRLHVRRSGGALLPKRVCVAPVKRRTALRAAHHRGELVLLVPVLLPGGLVALLLQMGVGRLHSLYLPRNALRLKLRDAWSVRALLQSRGVQVLIKRALHTKHFPVRTELVPSSSPATSFPARAAAGVPSPNLL